MAPDVGVLYYQVAPLGYKRRVGVQLGEHMLGAVIRIQGHHHPAAARATSHFTPQTAIYGTTVQNGDRRMRGCQGFHPGGIDVDRDHVSASGGLQYGGEEECTTTPARTRLDDQVRPGLDDDLLQHP
jgi:hypothetical protein